MSVLKRTVAVRWLFFQLVPTAYVLVANKARILDSHFLITLIHSERSKVYGVFGLSEGIKVNLCPM